MQEGRNWAQLLYTCSKIHHLHGELGQGEVWITSWLFHFAGWGSFSCFSSRLPWGQSRCQPRGIFSSSPEAEWSLWVLAKDFTSAHSSAHCWGLWLTLVPGSMRCPVEEELCSRQCSFKPSSLTPHPGPRYGTGCALDGGAHGSTCCPSRHPQLPRVTQGQRVIHD